MSNLNHTKQGNRLENSNLNRRHAWNVHSQLAAIARYLCLSSMTKGRKNQYRYRKEFYRKLGWSSLGRKHTCFLQPSRVYECSSRYLRKHKYVGSVFLLKMLKILPVSSSCVQMMMLKSNEALRRDSLPWCIPQSRQTTDSSWLFSTLSRVTKLFFSPRVTRWVCLFWKSEIYLTPSSSKSSAIRQSLM